MSCDLLRVRRGQGAPRAVAMASTPSAQGTGRVDGEGTGLQPPSALTTSALRTWTPLLVQTSLGKPPGRWTPAPQTVPSQRPHVSAGGSRKPGSPGKDRGGTTASGFRPLPRLFRIPPPRAPAADPVSRPPAGKPAPAHLAPRKRRLLPDLRARAVGPSPSPRSRTLSIPRVRPSPYTSRKPCPVPRPLLGALALSAGAQASYAGEQRSCSLPLSFSLREPARRRRRVNTCLLTGRRSRAAPSSPKGGEQHAGGGRGGWHPCAHGAS